MRDVVAFFRRGKTQRLFAHLLLSEGIVTEIRFESHEDDWDVGTAFVGFFVPLFQACVRFEKLWAGEEAYLVFYVIERVGTVY